MAPNKISLSHERRGPPVRRGFALTLQYLNLHQLAGVIYQWIAPRPPLIDRSKFDSIRTNGASYIARINAVLQAFNFAPYLFAPMTFRLQTVRLSSTVKCPWDFRNA